MDPGEAAVLLGITLITLFCIAAIMIGTAWFFGARFDNIWKSEEGYNWAGLANDASSASAVPSIEHKEL